MKFSLNKCLTAFPILLLSAMSLTARVYGAEGTVQTRAMQEYRDYCSRFESVKAKDDIADAGFRIIEDQIFPVELEGYGQVSFIPAYDTQYRRLALFFAAEDQDVVFKTDRLETNSQRRGSLSQPNEWLAAVSFQDMDNDGLSDIVLITACSYGDGGPLIHPEAPASAGSGIYKVGDVLFQKNGAFYRDYRLSNQLNRFGMNKNSCTPQPRRRNFWTTVSRLPGTNIIPGSLRSWAAFMWCREPTAWRSIPCSWFIWSMKRGILYGVSSPWGIMRISMGLRESAARTLTATG